MTGASNTAVGPIVVTGASGFIGQAIVRRLQSRGLPVLPVSRHPQPDLRAAIQVADYCDTPCPPNAILIHLAEEATIAAANARGSVHVEDVRRRVLTLLDKKYARVVYASSGQVYRKTAGDFYVMAKQNSEALILAAGGIAMRLANVYGPQMRHRTLIGDILRQIPGEGPLYIQNASPRRDFLWVDDAADGFIAVALGAETGAFDLGSGEVASAGEIARIALDKAGENGRPIVARDERLEDDTVAMDIAPLVAAFGWRPETTIAEGIARLVQDRL